MQEHPSYAEERCHAFHADITRNVSDNVPDNTVNIATMIFVLSAIHPDKMIQALKNIFQVS